jgi:hypothetical protein
MNWQDLKTFADIKAVPRGEFRAMLKHPEGAAHIDKLIAERKAALDEAAIAEAAAKEVVAEETTETAETEVVVDVEKTPEELAAEASEAARVIEEARVAEETEKARILAEANVKAAQDAEKVSKRYVYEFQATDEEGHPIGSKTHLEASSQEELDKKKEVAYLNAVRAIDRLKKQKPTFKKDEVIRVTTQEELDEAAVDIASDDPAKRAAAVRKLASNDLEQERQKVRLAEINANQKEQSYIFMNNHMSDYNRCQANGEALAAFIRDNNLDWTAENLEIAFGNLEAQLAPVPRSAAPASSVASEVINPTPAATVTAPVVPVAPAAVVAPAIPAATVPAANVVPAATPNSAAVPVRRAGVNSGLIPGQTLSGVKPLVKVAELTKKDIKDMSAEEMKRRHKIDPKFYDKVNALFAKK